MPLFAYKPVLYDGSALTFEFSSYESYSSSYSNSEGSSLSYSNLDTATPHSTFFFATFTTRSIGDTGTGSGYNYTTRCNWLGGYLYKTDLEWYGGRTVSDSWSWSYSYSSTEEEYTVAEGGITLTFGTNTSFSESAEGSYSFSSEYPGYTDVFVTEAAGPSSSGSTYSGLYTSAVLSTWENTFDYIASTTSSYTTLVEDTVASTSAVGTRSVRTTTYSETDAGGQLVSYHTELFADGTNEAVCIHTSFRTGAVCTLLGEPGVFAGDYVLISNRFFESTALRDEVAGVYDESLAGVSTTYGETLPEVSVVWDDYNLYGGVTTYDAATQIVSSKLTTYSSTRLTPSSEANTSHFDAVTIEGSAFISEMVSTTTQFRASLATYAQWVPIAQEPGASAIRGVRSFIEVKTVPTARDYVTTVDSSSSSSYSATGGYAGVFTTGEGSNSFDTYAEAGRTLRYIQKTKLEPENMPTPAAIPVLVRRAGLGGMQIPSAFSTALGRFSNPQFEQPPTQYGFAQRPAVLAPLFSDTDVTSATGGAAATNTAFLWDAFGVTTSYVVGENDRPATWDAFVITPVGVFMTAAYNDTSESGPSNLGTSYFQFAGQTTAALTGPRTVWEAVAHRSHGTESSELAGSAANSYGVLNGLETTTHRFYNNTEEFF
jgi:hypothetical protein